MGPDARDRRKYPRVPAEQMIAISPLGAESARSASRDERLAQGRDVSPGGIRFQAIGCEIEPGGLVQVFFNVEDETLSAVGRVVWATELDAFTTDVGVEFVELDPHVARLLGKLAAA